MHALDICKAGWLKGRILVKLIAKIKGNNSCHTHCFMKTGALIEDLSSSR